MHQQGASIEEASGTEFDWSTRIFFVGRSSRVRDSASPATKWKERSTIECSDMGTWSRWILCRCIFSLRRFAINSWPEMWPPD